MNKKEIMGRVWHLCKRPNLYTPDGGLESILSYSNGLLLSYFSESEILFSIDNWFKQNIHDDKIEHLNWTKRVFEYLKGDLNSIETYWTIFQKYMKETHNLVHTPPDFPHSGTERDHYC